MTSRLLISDANILIDMDVGGLLRQMFQLDVIFGVPDMLFEEELRDQHPELPQLGLKILEMGEAAVRFADELVARYRGGGVSTHDLLALSLARQEECPLLTGDAKLRNVAEQEDIEFHGTIWLVGQLIEARVVTVQQARGAYEEMRSSGRRLPWNEVDQQLEESRRRELRQ